VENKINNKGVIALLIVIIIILSALCVLFATGTISFKSDKVNDNEVNENVNDTNNEENENVNDTNNEENNSKEWVNYLKSKNVVVKTSVWNSEKDECEFNSVSISSEDINKIIDKLSTNKITKYYYGNVPPTGTICSDRFTLEYENNKISLDADGYVWVNDDILFNKIDLDVDNTTYADNYTEDSYVYKFDVNFADVFNNYK
jgi:hypothetical protein